MRVCWWVGAVWVAVASGGCEPSVTGPYVGTASENFEISAPGDSPGMRSITNGSESIDGTLIVGELDDGYEARLPNGCVVRFEAGEGRVDSLPDQTCETQAGAFGAATWHIDGALSVSDGSVELDLVGALPQPSDTSGSWGYSFGGTRAE